ncbi:MAG: hypothetical protein ABIF71_08370 [Planctomycetota bacterium]
MSLASLLAEGRLRAHTTSAHEVADLMRVVERDLADAQVTGLSADRWFATAYNAALQLAMIVLHAAGYRATGAGHHWGTLQVLPEILGAGTQVRADYFDRCRAKRNTTDYDRAGEIITETCTFRDDVVTWLKKHHSRLASGFGKTRRP